MALWPCSSDRRTCAKTLVRFPSGTDQSPVVAAVAAVTTCHLAEALFAAATTSRIVKIIKQAVRIKPPS